MQHTDRDERWTGKHGKSHYGYKVHSNVDARWKLIEKRGSEALCRFVWNTTTADWRA